MQIETRYIIMWAQTGIKYHAIVELEVKRGEKRKKKQCGKREKRGKLAWEQRGIRRERGWKQISRGCRNKRKQSLEQIRSVEKRGQIEVSRREGGNGFGGAVGNLRARHRGRDLRCRLVVLGRRRRLQFRQGFLRPLPPWSALILLSLYSHIVFQGFVFDLSLSFCFLSVCRNICVSGGCDVQLRQKRGH